MRYCFRLAQGPDELSSTFSLRHLVYAEERKWISSSPDGRYSDAWDKHSESFVALDSDRLVKGTVRMIHYSELGFPYEKIEPLPGFINPDTCYEVSCLAVAPEARGKNSLILVGLCRSIWKRAHSLRMDHWCAVIDEKVAEVLRLLKFKFAYEGSALFYMGSASIPIVCEMEQSREILFSPRLDRMLEKHIEEVYGPD